MNRYKTVLVLVCALLCLALIGCAVSNGSAKAPDPEKGEAAASPAPDDVSAEDPKPNDSYVSGSTYFRELAAISRSILDGAQDAALPGDLSLWAPTVHFIADHDPAGQRFVNAYASFITLYPSGSDETEEVWYDPVCHIPYEAALSASNRLIELGEAHMISFMDHSPDEFGEWDGCCGDGWFLLQTGGLLNVSSRLFTLWRTDDGADWYEFTSSDEAMPLITGACMTDEGSCVLCCYSFGYSENGGESRAYIINGKGAEWKRIELSLPEEYMGYVQFSLFAPTFDGNRGVILFCGSYENEDALRAGYFLTEDGGENWAFYGLSN